MIEDNLGKILWDIRKRQFWQEKLVHIYWNMDFSKKKLCDYTECDLLALATLVTKEISKVVKDIDTLNMVGDLITSIGASVTLLANQRDRCAKDVRVSTTS